MDQSKTIWRYDANRVKLDMNQYADIYKTFQDTGIVGAIDDHNIKWFFKGI